MAIIVFGSGSTASISPNSEVEISKFEQEAFTGPLPTDSEPSVSNTQIKIHNGEVTSKVAKLKTGSEYVVSTPVGAAGVRGTIFAVFYNSITGDYRVVTLSGAVVFLSTNGVGVDVNGGFGYDGSAVTPLTAAQKAAIEAAVRNFAGTNLMSWWTRIEVTVPENDPSLPIQSAN